MSSSLKRVLRIRAMQEELAQAELEVEAASLRGLERQVAEAAGQALASRERWFAAAERESSSAAPGVDPDRAAEDSAWEFAVWRRARAEAWRQVQQAEVERARVGHLEGRRDRMQVESLVETAKSRLQVGDSALGSVVSQLTSAITLATEANNGTLSTSNVVGISNQLVSIRNEVLSLANTSYLGTYLFSGSQGSTAPFTLNASATAGAAATVTYNGDAITTSLETPNGQSIQLNVPGAQIFSTGVAGTDVFQTLNNLIADFATGTPSATAVTDTENLTTALSNVSEQRVTLDGSITALQNAASYTQNESAELLAAQTTLLQADYGKVSTQLSAAETQQTALYDVISTLEKGSLFDYIAP